MFNSYPEAKPMPGAWELLQKVKKDGLIPMVVTGSGQLSLLERLEHPFLKALAHADPIIGNDEPYEFPMPDFLDWRDVEFDPAFRAQTSGRWTASSSRLA